MKPVLQALVLAEHIYVDRDSGKCVITGTFNAMQVWPQTEEEQASKARLTSGPGSPWAYISLTDVCDGTELSLQFVSLTLNKILFSKDIKLQSNDRLATIEIVDALPHLHVPGPGVCAFEIVCEGEVIGSHRVVVTMVNPPG